jgi:hypothetical protein
VFGCHFGVIRQLPDSRRMREALVATRKRRNCEKFNFVICFVSCHKFISNDN